MRNISAAQIAKCIKASVDDELRVYKERTEGRVRDTDGTNAKNDLTNAMETLRELARNLGDELVGPNVTDELEAERAAFMTACGFEGH